MACTQLTDIGGIADLMIYPTVCDYYFWLKILLVINFLIGWGIYKTEEKRKGEGDFISAFAVSSLGVAILGFFGTLIVGDTGTLVGIPMIQLDILLILIAIAIPLLIIWVFKTR